MKIGGPDILFTHLCIHRGLCHWTWCHIFSRGLSMSFGCGLPLEPDDISKNVKNIVFFFYLPTALLIWPVFDITPFPLLRHWWHDSKTPLVRRLLFVSPYHLFCPKTERNKGEARSMELRLIYITILSLWGWATFSSAETMVVTQIWRICIQKRKIQSEIKSRYLIYEYRKIGLAYNFNLKMCKSSFL